MSKIFLSVITSACVLFVSCGKPCCEKPHTDGARGWLSWRGPQQDGVSLETGLPDKWEVGGANDLWSYKISGRGTPVVADGKLYVWGYDGEGADLQEVLLCLDAESGQKIWEQRFSDFLSDIVYTRYSIGAPTVDRETGNVYLMTSPGLLIAFSADGKKLWEHSTMEELGRLSFPNGRTGSPVIDGDLVIIHGISSNWGRDGAAADRFYAFDKRSGEVVWSSTPGTIPPKDSSFSTPVLAWQNGKRVLYAGTGDGCLVCVNARTGDALWRYKFSAGGVNTSPVLFGDSVITGHADENLDNSETGRTLAVKIGAEPAAGQKEPAELKADAEVWRNKEILLTSSPVVVGPNVFIVNKVGELCCIEGKTGNVAWRHKLGPDQLHASPTFADGKLYVPMRDGGFHILRPKDGGVETLCRTQLEGEALGAPAVWNGKIYVMTTAKLYCFGRKGNNPGLPAAPAPEKAPAPGALAQVQVVPCDVVMRPGTTRSFKLRGLDANGLFVKALSSGQWKTFIPPTAKVKSTMAGEFNAKDELAVKADAPLSAGAWQVTVKDGDREVKGTMRGRLVAALPFREDFEGFKPQEQPDAPGAGAFAWPPLPWMGARFKWDIREQDRGKVLHKTLDRILFQRAFTFIGEPTAKNYTIQADVMSDGNRRNQSNVGVICQRYVVNLVGNWQQLEVLSNQDRVKVTVPFAWQPKVWFTLKARVDVAPDGSGVVRAKAWKRGEPEPAAWTIEAPHKHAHTEGSPGVYGFSLQSQFAVHVDNIIVTPNN